MAYNFSLQKQAPVFNRQPAAFKTSQQHVQASGGGVAAGCKTKLTKKYTIDGFKVTDFVWMRPSDGRHKLEVLVRYIDPEQCKTKRLDGSY